MVLENFAGIVPAGGGARRLGGRDKPALHLGGRSLLDRTLDALEDAEPVVVVGPRRPVRRSVLWTWEDPAGGGPLAGLAAGLAALPDGIDRVAVLAADHPGLIRDTVHRLAAAAARPDVAGSVLTDPDGRPQWLVGVWSVEALTARMPRSVHGGSVRSALEPLCPVRVPAVGTEALDIDTAEDLHRAQAEHDG